MPQTVSELSRAVIYGIQAGKKNMIADLEPLNAILADRAELLLACKMLEAAELEHTNCEECGGNGVPELCGRCFPAFDDARLARRKAISKAEGRS